MNFDPHSGPCWDNVRRNSDFNSIIEVNVAPSGGEFPLLRLIIESDTRVCRGLMQGVYMRSEYTLTQIQRSMGIGSIQFYVYLYMHAHIQEVWKSSLCYCCAGKLVYS